jgi:multidrug efflux pump subunit AcrB
MQQVGGLASVSLTWQDDKRELRFTADPQRCALYGISPREAANQVQTFLQGGVSTFYRLPGEDSLPVRVRLAAEARNRPERLEQLLLHTPLGEVPLGSLGRFSTADTPALLTRQDLQNSINLLGYRETAAVSHIMDNVTTALQGFSLPPGYSLTQEGESKQAAESFSALMAALTIGMILLYFSLVPAFNSFLHPLTIMTAIPLALIGAIWSLLATGKHQSMGAFMGLILLAGIVVKNSILLIDFIEVARSQGMPLREALRQSVQVRTRPILMTAFGTAVGMLPIALERAIGLERLSPLAVVAIGGLLVSTFLTLIYVPIFYTLFDELGEKVRGWGKGR